MDFLTGVEEDNCDAFSYYHGRTAELSELVNQMKTSAEPGAHFFHVTGNLLIPMVFFAESIAEIFEDKQMETFRKQWHEAEKHLASYLAILKRPVVAMKELGKDGAYFADLRYTDAFKYVQKFRELVPKTL